MHTTPIDAEKWGHSHETDPAIARAILHIAQDGEDAEIIWQYGTHGEVAAIIEIVTCNAPMTDEHREMSWGCVTLGEIVDELTSRG